MCLLACASAATAQDTTAWKNRLDSGLLRKLHLQSDRQTRLATAKTKEVWEPVIIVFEDETTASPGPGDGIRIMARRGRVATAMVRLDALPSLASASGIRKISADSEGHVLDNRGKSSVKARRVNRKLELLARA